MNKLNIIIIGLGPHAQKAYLPILAKYKGQYNVDVKLGIDLKSQEASVRKYLSDSAIELNTLFIDPFEGKEELPVYLKKYLTGFVKDNDIKGVIISTEPLYHKAYAKWALKNELHILMDKPVTTRQNVVTDYNEAAVIYKDYEELKVLYDNMQKGKNTMFSVNVQRRYHLGFRKVLSLIKEVAERFDAPVTSVQSMHADGQWRMPNEIVDQLYHPYCQGYGKCSHSGYHIFDIVSQFYKAGYREGKYADNAEIMSSFLTPSGFLKQFNEKNHSDYFGKGYEEVNTRPDSELKKLFKGYGEMDAFVLLRLLRQDVNICNISINLLHNSFARRTWMQPGADLYKGNGRVKHESHVIQQGPFQCIQVHSYQSNDKHDVNKAEDDLWGGNNHFDIFVYRNSGMFGNNEKPMQLHKLRDKDLFKDYESKSLVHNISKEFVVLEFINFMRGEVCKENLLSNFDTHELGVQIMSSIYRSHIQYINNASPLVKFALNNREEASL